MTPEQKARVSIDALLTQAGWHVCDMAHANIDAERGVALREFPLNTASGKTFTSISFIYRLIKFGEEYIVQNFTSNQLDTTARVIICTIQRLFSMLKLRANIVTMKFQRI